MSSTIRGSDNFNSTLSSTLGSSTTNTMHQKAISDAIKFGVAPTHTANATFTGIDNKIVMPGIVTALQLEVGDVIVFSNAIAQNNKPRTVESITDNNTIIVNYEHCGSRGNGSLKLTDETVAGASVKLLAKWYNAPIGLGQAWVNVTTFRSVATIFYNSTNRAIQIRTTGGSAGDCVSVQEGGAGSFVELQSAAGAAAYSGVAQYIIPGRSNYRNTYSLAISLASGGWQELR